MALGPGKYNALVTRIMDKAPAQGVILIIINGVLGSGFSVQATAKITAGLPTLLQRSLTGSSAIFSQEAV